MAYELFAAVDTDYNFPPEVREALATSVELRNSVVPMTQTQRNNLVGEDLWDGRMVLNKTTNRVNRYSATDLQWYPLLELSDVPAPAVEPPGIIKMYGGTTPPDARHLMCDGTTKPRTGSTAGLFGVFGTRYNTGGEAADEFRLPNLKGKVPVGLDPADATFDTLGETGGEKAHTLSVAEMPAHSHNEAVDSSYNAGTGTGVPTHYALNSNGANRSEVPMATGSTGGGAAHNNLQPFIVVNFIVTL